MCPIFRKLDVKMVKPLFYIADKCNPMLKLFVLSTFLYITTTSYSQVSINGEVGAVIIGSSGSVTVVNRFSKNEKNKMWYNEITSFPIVKPYNFPNFPPYVYGKSYASGFIPAVYETIEINNEVVKIKIGDSAWSEWREVICRNTEDIITIKYSDVIKIKEKLYNIGFYIGQITSNVDYDFIRSIKILERYLNIEDENELLFYPIKIDKRLLIYLELK